MYIAKGLAELHTGASVKGESDGRSMGSKFSLRLPLLHDAAISALNLKNNTATEKLIKTNLSTLLLKVAPLTILVVDDSYSNRKMLSYLLERLGHTVVEAENGEQAVGEVMRSVLNKGDPSVEQFDCILMDYNMPIMNGLEALKELKRIQYDGHVIGVSADDKDIIEFLKEGAAYTLLKPIEKVNLVEVLLMIQSRRKQKLPMGGHIDPSVASDGSNSGSSSNNSLDQLYDQQIDDMSAVNRALSSLRPLFLWTQKMLSKLRNWRTIFYYWIFDRSALSLSEKVVLLNEHDKKLVLQLTNAAHDMRSPCLAIGLLLEQQESSLLAIRDGSTASLNHCLSLIQQANTNVTLISMSVNRSLVCTKTIPFKFRFYLNSCVYVCRILVKSPLVSHSSRIQVRSMLWLLSKER